MTREGILQVGAGLIIAVGSAVAGYSLAPGPESKVERTATSLHSSPAPVPTDRSQGIADAAEGPTREELEVLEWKLGEEVAARRAAEAKVMQLRKRLLALESADDSRLEQSGVAPGIQSSEAVAAKVRLDSTDGIPGEQKPWFNGRLLEQAGLSNSEIEEVKEVWEEHEMEKLYLTDDANRNGTIRTKGFYDRLANLNRTVREELGDDLYDAFLYATGTPNRVMVKQVLENSPAGYSGLATGDVVIRYSGERIFHAARFKQATADGEVGRPVSIEVERDGEVFSFSIPRGPLGVQLSRGSHPPRDGL